MKHYKECPIAEYVRIVKLKDAPASQLTDDELWVLYTKAKDDIEFDAFNKTSFDYLKKYEAELQARGLLTSTQLSMFDEGAKK